MSGVSLGQQNSRTLTLPLLCAFLSLIPFAWNFNYFKDLFWFGDELHLLLQIQDHGFFELDVEHPLLKTLFQYLSFFGEGQLMFFGGSYLAMLSIVWLTHAINTALLAIILLRYNFSTLTTFIASLTFALAWSNIENLRLDSPMVGCIKFNFFLNGICLFSKACHTK